MLNTRPQIIGCAAVFALLGVVLGAFGAHALKESLTQQGTTYVWETAVDYQMWHALALMIAGLLTSKENPKRSLIVASWCFAIGIVLFSGSLYWLALDGPNWLGPITPTGGLLFVSGWAALIRSCWGVHESN